MSSVHSPFSHPFSFCFLIYFHGFKSQPRISYFQLARSSLSSSRLAYTCLTLCVSCSFLICSPSFLALLLPLCIICFALIRRFSLPAGLGQSMFPTEDLNAGGVGDQWVYYPALLFILHPYARPHPCLSSIPNLFLHRLMLISLALSETGMVMSLRCYWLQRTITSLRFS